VMPSMDEMKATPLGNAERTQGEMGETGSGAEVALGPGQDCVHAGKARGDFRGEDVPGRRRIRRLRGRHDDARSLAPAGKQAHVDDNDLSEELRGRRS